MLGLCDSNEWLQFLNFFRMLWAVRGYVNTQPGSMITNPRAAQRKFRVRVGVVFSLGFRVSVRVVRFE